MSAQLNHSTDVYVISFSAPSLSIGPENGSETSRKPGLMASATLLWL